MLECANTSLAADRNQLLVRLFEPVTGWGRGTFCPRSPPQLRHGGPSLRWLIHRSLLSATTLMLAPRLPRLSAADRLSRSALSRLGNVKVQPR